MTVAQLQTFELATNAAENQDWALASDYLQRLVAQRPNDPRTMARLGWSLQKQQMPDRAEEAYRKALALDPSTTLASNNLALLLQEQHRFVEAAEVLRAGVRQSPENSELHYNLGIICELYLLDLECALEQYQAYQSVAYEKDEAVEGWIADLKRRLAK